MRISDWSSDVCSSDLGYHGRLCRFMSRLTRRQDIVEEVVNDCFWVAWQHAGEFRGDARVSTWLMGIAYRCGLKALRRQGDDPVDDAILADMEGADPGEDRERSEEHTSELQSLMRISYAVFCLKKKNQK